MIKGPGRTPYEDGLFFFDVQLPNNYPSAPPLFFYISYCSDRLNPNLYEDGKVCVSLLGTWTGRASSFLLLSHHLVSLLDGYWAILMWWSYVIFSLFQLMYFNLHYAIMYSSARILSLHGISNSLRVFLLFCCCFSL